MQTDDRLPKVPSVRANKFITGFRAATADSGTPRKEALDAWMRLKSQPDPNTFEEHSRLTFWPEAPEGPG